jgi:hypothetical protein
LHGDPVFSQIDNKKGRVCAKAAAGDSDPIEKAEEILNKARRFVVQADLVIHYAAVGLLGLIPKHGELNRAKTTRLAAALRPKVPKYHRL